MRFITKRFVLSILVFAILYVVSDLTLWADIAQPTFAVQALITVSIGFALAVVMGLIFTQIPLRRRGHFLLAWPVLFVIQWLTPMLEGFFFTTMLTEFLLLAGLIFGVLLSLFHAILVAILFPSSLSTSPLRIELQSYFSQRPRSSWLWRLALSSASFLLIFYTIGHLISVLVIPFYVSPDFELRIPPIPVILGLELFRGFLYVITLVPILATLKTDLKTKWILIALIHYLPGIVFFLPDMTLPVVFRAIHGVEIFIDSVLFSGVLTYLLGVFSPSSNSLEV